jgi:hypothetical protein
MDKAIPPAFSEYIGRALLLNTANGKGQETHESHA